MTDLTIKDRIEFLQKEINRHNHIYYVLDRAEISDAQYDELMRELRSLESKYPHWLMPDSPTQRIGDKPAAAFVQAEHPVPLLSLGNVFGSEEFDVWYRRIVGLVEDSSFDMVCELKYDGLAVSLTYQDGVLTRGATRGDGKVGEDVTANLKTVRSVPLSLWGKVPRTLEVRGEVIFPKSEFHKLNRSRIALGLPTYSHPRNTAAGSLRQLDPRVTADRMLDIFIYGLGYSDGGVVPSNHWDVLEYLAGLGFKVNPNNRLVDSSFKAIRYCQEWLEKCEDLDYGCDGVVIKINSLELQRHLGVVGRDPRWAIAYKFPATQSITRLKDIRFKVGRTGSINPYAVLEPVDIAGVTVRRSTLHNEDYIRDKDLRINDWVVVERAGEVIPQIVTVLTDRRNGDEQKFSMPKRCPSCAEYVVRREGESSTFCVNAACPEQLIRLLGHFVSKIAMDIEGLGIKQTSALLHKGLIQDVADLYSLRREQLTEMEGMADKSAKNMLDAIEKSKKRPLPNVLVALGIEHIGSEVSESLTRRFKTIDVLIAATKDELEAIPSVGAKISESVTEYFSRKSNRKVIEKLKQAGVRMEGTNPTGIIGQFLVGLRFVVTGRLVNFSRAEVEGRIKECGGSISGSVSSNTDFLVAGEDAGSKYSDAERLQVPILNEQGFLDFLKQRQREQITKPD